MNIYYIELENFKSFRGIHKVGPFTSMTGIIGPNGCGKSNIVDALTFAFHIENARNNHPISSIISQQHKADLCSVEVVLQDKRNKYSFKKTQTRKKQITFYINNKNVNQEEYLDELRKYNIGPQSFMLQGETDKLIKKSPEELSEIIEKACGSIKFKQQYDDIQKNIKEINEQTIQIISEQKNLRKDDLKLKTISEQNEKYESLNQEIKQIEIKIEQANFFQIDSSILDEMKTLKMNQKNLDDRKGEESQIKLNVQNNNKKIKELQKKLENKQKENENVKKLIRQLVGELELQEEQLNKAKNFQENVELQKNLQKQTEDLNEKIAKLNAEINKENTKLNEMSSQETQKNKIDNKNLKENYLEYQELVRQYNSETLDQELELKKLGNDLNSANSQLKVSMEAKQKQNAHIGDLESKISEAKTSYLSKQGELAKKQEDLVQIKNNLEQLEKSRKDNLRKIEIIQKDLSILLQNKLSLEYEMESMEELRNQTKVEKELDKIKGFYGQLSGLIKNSSHKSYDLAIKIALGSMLNCLVVDTPQTASLVNVSLGSQGLSRDVMILSNLPNVGDSLTKANLGNNGETLASLVDIDDRNLKYQDNDAFKTKIGETLRYLLRGKVVCETTEKAFQLRNRKIPEIYQIITKDGDIITSGSIQISSSDKEKYSKKDLGTEQNISNLKKKIDNEVKQIDKKMAELDTLKNSDSEKKYNKYIEQQQQCDSSIALLKTELQGLEEKIKKLDEKKQSVSNVSAKYLEVENLEKTVKEIEKRLENVKQNKEQKRESKYKSFCEKHKIDMKELVSQDAETLERHFKNIEKQQQKVQDLINSKNSYQDKLQNVKNQHQKYTENKKKYEEQKEQFSSIQNKYKNSQKEKETENKNIQIECNEIEKEIQKLTEENEKSYEQLISQPNQLRKEIIQIKHSIGQLIDKKETLWLECQMKQIDFKDGQKLSQMKDFGSEESDEDDEDKSQDKSDQTGDSDSLNEKNNIKELNRDFTNSFKHYTQALSQLKDQKLQEYLNKFSELQMLNYTLLFTDRSQFMKKRQKQQQNKDSYKSDSLLNQLLESVDINSLLTYQNRLVDDLEELKKKIEDYASKDLAEGLIGVQITSEDMRNKKDALKNKLSELTVQKKKAEDELKNVKKLRQEKFEDFFKEVSNYVKVYYGELTKLKGKEKGTAELTYSNQDEKYIGGINYICCPPKKQYTLNPEKDLSGGEKTLAQMALYLAIAKNSPFLVLDESEAALDSSNTINVIETLKNHITRQQKLIVSHHHVVYQECESLVGATYNREQDTSFALSLNLKA